MKLFVKYSLPLCCFILFLLSGCKTTSEVKKDTAKAVQQINTEKNVKTLSGHRLPEKKKNGEGYHWTASRISRELNGTDPIEPFNRSMFACTDFCMRWIVRYLGYIYGSIMPREGVKRIEYFSHNLAFPGRMFSCFLQAQYKGGGIEFARFMTNTTIGIGGLFDPAEAWFDLQKQHEDFGQTFGWWGIEPGCLFYLPFTTKFNVRDSVGMIFDKAFDLKTYIPYLGYLTTVNSAVSDYDIHTAMLENYYDPYDMCKTALGALRYAQVQNYQQHPQKPEPVDAAKEIPDLRYEGNVVRASKEYGTQGALVDTIKSSFHTVKNNNKGLWIKTSLWNTTDFIPKGETRTIRMSPELPEMEYQIWRSKYPHAPLILLVPGAGSHYRANSLRAIAELFYDQGWSALVVPNSLNPAFSVPTGHYFPGYVPEDAALLRKVLAKILEDLRKNTPLVPERIAACGYSLGAMQLLHIASMEEKEGNPLHISRYVAINPPVDILYALHRLDYLGHIPDKMSRQEFLDMLGDIAIKFFYIIKRPDPNPGQVYTPVMIRVATQLALSPEQAGWLASIYMRMGLRELLFSAQKNAPASIKPLKTPYQWGRRTKLYEEIDQYDWTGYLEKILIPSIHKKDPSATLQSLAGKSSLRAIRDTLKKNPRVRVIHNMTDPLLRPKDVVFLDRIMKNRIVWFDCGGHLGNLYLPEFCRQILIQAQDPKHPWIKPEEPGTAKKETAK